MTSPKNRTKKKPPKDSMTLLPCFYFVEVTSVHSRFNESPFGGVFMSSWRNNSSLSAKSLCSCGAASHRPVVLGVTVLPGADGRLVSRRGGLPLLRPRPLYALRGDGRRAHPTTHAAQPGFRRTRRVGKSLASSIFIFTFIFFQAPLLAKIQFLKSENQEDSFALNMKLKLA